MNDLKISVIMPTYNCDRFISKSIDSYLAQELNETELICVNDGSTDGTARILHHYQNNYPDKVIVIEQTNQGAAIARNKAITESRGEYLYFLDSDDLIPNSVTLSNLYHAAVDNKVHIAGGSLIMFDEKGEYTDFTGKEGLDGQQFTENQLTKYTDYQFDSGYQRFIYRRSLLIDNNLFFPNYRRYQDPPFFVKAMSSAQEFYALREATYKYHLRESHINWLPATVIVLLDAILDVATFAAENNLEHLFCLSLLRLRSDYYHIIANSIFKEGNKDVLQSYLFTEEMFRRLSLRFSNIPPLEVFPLIGKRVSNDLLELNALRTEHAALISRHGSILNSNTWKAGKALTFLPKKARDLIHKLKKNSEKQY